MNATTTRSQRSDPDDEDDLDDNLEPDDPDDWRSEADEDFDGNERADFYGWPQF